MTEAAIITAATVPLRDWLQARDIGGVVGSRVYAGGLPTDAVRPCMAILRVGGRADAPLDLGLYQLDSYGTTGAQAEAVDAAARTVLASTPASTALTGALHLMGSNEESAGLLTHDPDTGEPRYSTTVEIIIKAL
jgi:hypothetical protein